MRTRKWARSGLVGLTAAALVTACLMGSPPRRWPTRPRPSTRRPGSTGPTERRSDPRSGSRRRSRHTSRAARGRARRTRSGHQTSLDRRVASPISGWRSTSPGSGSQAATSRPSSTRSGRLVSLIENTVRGDRPARGEGRARPTLGRAAIRSLYPGGAPRWLQRPTVREGRGADERWSPLGGLPRPHLGRTTTSSTRRWSPATVAVVRSESRTASDGYNVFPEDPDKTPQTLVTNPADLDRLAGRLAAPATSSSNNISGNNAHAYLDRDNDNAPDRQRRARVTDGVFDTAANLAAQPDDGDQPGRRRTEPLLPQQRDPRRRCTTPVSPRRRATSRTTTSATAAPAATR